MYNYCCRCRLTAPMLLLLLPLGWRARVCVRERQQSKHKVAPFCLCFAPECVREDDYTLATESSRPKTPCPMYSPITPVTPWLSSPTFSLFYTARPVLPGRRQGRTTRHVTRSQQTLILLPVSTHTQRHKGHASSAHSTAHKPPLLVLSTTQLRPHKTQQQQPSTAPPTPNQN